MFISRGEKRWPLSITDNGVNEVKGTEDEYRAPFSVMKHLGALSLMLVES